MASTTRYAKSGDVHIAYRTLGSGPVDIVVAEQWFSNVEIEREVRPLARFNDRLAGFARVIRFDKRGVGLSDPVPATALPTLEEWMDDLRAVLDHIGSEKAAIVTAMAGGFLACVFAATYPDRVRALVLIDGFARMTRTDDYPWGLTADQARDIIQAFGSAWGTGMMLDRFDPDDADDVALRESWGRYERHSVSPGTAASMVEMINATDIREILPADPGPDARRRSDGYAGRVRARPVPGRADPRRDVRRAPGPRQPAVVGRPGRPASRDRTLRHGISPGSAARPRARNRALHRHRRLDRPRGRDRRRQMAGTPRRARSARPSCARPVRRTRGEDDG